MLKLYDKQSSIIFPDGSEWDTEKLKNNQRYSKFFTNETVLGLDDDGRLNSFYFLSDLKKNHGISESDPQKALDQIIQLQEKEAKLAAANITNMADIQEQLDLQGDAIDALIQMTLGD